MFPGSNIFANPFSCTKMRFKYHGGTVTRREGLSNCRVPDLTMSRRAKLGDKYFDPSVAAQFYFTNARNSPGVEAGGF